jgi:hypothetical protein
MSRSITEQQRYSREDIENMVKFSAKGPNGSALVVTSHTPGSIVNWKNSPPS